MAITRLQQARQMFQFGGGADMGASSGPSGPPGGGEGGPCWVRPPRLNAHQRHGFWC